jgi:multidrug efflux pump
MTISSDVEVGLLVNNKVNELRDWLSANPIDERVHLSFKGDELDQRENSNFLLLAFAFGLFLMAGILLIEFNSFYSVLIILSSVILSTIGVLFGYMITGTSFNVVMSGMGLIALAGIVVNNNIVLLDTYERLIKTAPTAFDALIQTGAQRLRPVFLTTLTTVLGLVPMAFEVSIDFFTRSIAVGAPAMSWWQQISITIIFGLIFATILTLVVTPCTVMLQARRSEKRQPTVPLSAGAQIPAE